MFNTLHKVSKHIFTLNFTRIYLKICVWISIVNNVIWHIRLRRCRIDLNSTRKIWSRILSRVEELRLAPRRRRRSSAPQAHASKFAEKHTLGDIMYKIIACTFQETVCRFECDKSAIITVVSSTSRDNVVRMSPRNTPMGTRHCYMPIIRLFRRI